MKNLFRFLFKYKKNSENTILRVLTNNYNNKLLTLIPADSGPGNQIIGIKECLILSKLLNRICIIPPIREHYLKSNNIFYKFDDIFNLNLSFIKYDNDKSEIFNKIDDKIRYCINNNYFNKTLRHEQIIKSKKNKEILLKKRLIRKINDLDEIKKKKNTLIVIKHLFNNVFINESGINGDFGSILNSNFLDIYQDICSKWDFSKNIKKIGNNFIETNFNQSKFIAIHIRLPDIMSKDISNYTNNKYSSSKIIEILSNLKITENKKPIFIASNNILYLKNIGIDENFLDSCDKFSSFIEQYICCQSEKFFYLNLENTRFDSSNNRSTWTSFVIDYRNFFNKLYNNFNLRRKYE